MAAHPHTPVDEFIALLTAACNAALESPGAPIRTTVEPQLLQLVTLWEAREAMRVQQTATKAVAHAPKPAYRRH